MAFVGTLVHQRSTSVRAEVTKTFWEIAGAHGICPEVHYPVPEFATLAGGDWVHRILRALAALGVGLYNPIACPRAAHVQLQSPPGNIVTLLTAKLRHRDTCRLTVPHTTEAGPDPRGHLWVTWGVYLCARKPPLADIILSHPPDLTRCDSVIGLAIPAMSGHIQYRSAASGDLYIRISGINRVFFIIMFP